MGGDDCKSDVASERVYKPNDITKVTEEGSQVCKMD